MTLTVNKVAFATGLNARRLPELDRFGKRWMLLGKPIGSIEELVDLFLRVSRRLVLLYPFDALLRRAGNCAGLVQNGISNQSRCGFASPALHRISDGPDFIER